MKQHLQQISEEKENKNPRANDSQHSSNKTTINIKNSNSTIMDLAETATHIDNLDMSSYDDAILHDNLLVNLNKQLLHLLKVYRCLQKYKLPQQGSISRNDRRFGIMTIDMNNNTNIDHRTGKEDKKIILHNHNQQLNITMVKISIICSCLNKIYLSCTWSALHLVFQESKRQETYCLKNVNDDQEVKSMCLNALNNSQLLVIDTVLRVLSSNNTDHKEHQNDKSHDEKKNSMRSSSSSSSSLLLSSSSSFTDTTCTTVTASVIALKKTLSSMCRISSIAATQMNVKTAVYMVELLKTTMTMATFVQFRICHCYAVTILANLINYQCFCIDLMDDLFDVLLLYLQENYSTEDNNNGDGSNDKNDNDDCFGIGCLEEDHDGDCIDKSKLLFLEETWRLILHLSSFDQKLAHRVCKLHPSRFFSSIVAAMDKGSVKLKLLSSHVLKEMSDDEEVAKIMSKEARIYKSLIKIISSETCEDETFINCINATIAIALSTKDIDDLLKYKDALPILIKFISKNSELDKKLKAEIKNSIIHISNAMLLETTCV